MQDVLAVALKAKMAGLDDPGMHRSDRHFMHFLAVRPEKIPVRGPDRVAGPALPGIPVRCVGGVKADGFEPWVPLRDKPPLFRDFAFEPVGLGAVGGEGGKGFAHIGCENSQGGRHRLGQHGQQPRGITAARRGEIGRDPGPGRDL